MSTNSTLVKHLRTLNTSIVPFFPKWEMNFRCTMRTLLPFCSGQVICIHLPSHSRRPEDFLFPWSLLDVKEKVYKYITIWYCQQRGSPSLSGYPVRELVSQAYREPKGRLEGGDSGDEREKWRNVRSNTCPQRLYEIGPAFEVDKYHCHYYHNTSSLLFFSSVSFLHHPYPQCLAQTRHKINAY